MGAERRINRNIHISSEVEQMTEKETLDALRSVSVTGTPLSTNGLMDLARQFEKTGAECDSASHEVAAMSMRWAARRIEDMKSSIKDAKYSVDVMHMVSEGKTHGVRREH